MKYLIEDTESNCFSDSFSKARHLVEVYASTNDDHWYCKVCGVVVASKYFKFKPKICVGKCLASHFNNLRPLNDEELECFGLVV